MEKDYSIKITAQQIFQITKKTRTLSGQVPKRISLLKVPLQMNQ